MQNFIIDLIVIGGLCFVAIFLIKDVQREPGVTAILKSIASLALIICAFVYYFSYVEENPEYTRTCHQCGESFATDDRSTSKLCDDCARDPLSDEAAEEGMQQFLDDVKGKLEKSD